MRRLLLALAVACGLPATAPAQDGVFKEVEVAVNKRIAPELKAANVTQVSLDWVVTPSKAKLLGSAGISQAFEDCLGRHNIAVVAGQSAKILVIVSPIECDPVCKLPGTKLTIKLSVNGKEVCEVSRAVFGTDCVVVLESLPVALPPGATPEQVTQVIAEARKAPPVVPPKAPRATKQSSADGAVSIEMLVAPAGVKEPKDADFVARPLDAKGRVPVRPGETYRLRVTSAIPYPIAVATTVDGLDWSAFLDPLPGQEKAERRRLFVVVPANGTATVNGWAKTLDTSLAFDVTRLPTTAAGRQAEVGVVQIRYAACWNLGDKPPPGEPSTENTLSGVATGQGVEKADKKQIVQRAVGNMRGSVQLVYGEFKD